MQNQHSKTEVQSANLNFQIAVWSPQFKGSGFACTRLAAPLCPACVTCFSVTGTRTCFGRSGCETACASLHKLRAVVTETCRRRSKTRVPKWPVSHEVCALCHVLCHTQKHRKMRPRTRKKSGYGRTLLWASGLPVLLLSEFTEEQAPAP